MIEFKTVRISRVEGAEGRRRPNSFPLIYNSLFFPK